MENSFKKNINKNKGTLSEILENEEMKIRMEEQEQVEESLDRDLIEDIDYWNWKHCCGI